MQQSSNVPFKLNITGPFYATNGLTFYLISGCIQDLSNQQFGLPIAETLYLSIRKWVNNQRKTDATAIEIS